MENCTYCGKQLVDSDAGDWYGDSECTGELRYDEDPFAAEIYDDHTFVWMCDGQRYESSMDI
ncbi:hypothetical protein SEA_DAUBENSKI_133 [Streptomyces phage Daubenski]|uniref:Uncharacterized protein n=1 Tax=Streptomyces phage Daubenski TaxID=2653725 RepID=A0A5Q2WGA5_9CAUD|nr:hypothetical protein KNU80_gp144 [Streptomyces phage Daubenski]QGH76428.1 hypothetical protein SEA_DAUBENSKI_133 [Streptomyces phage Daubenski]